ncbi:hypothetical protein [Rhodocista pekingensis]|uniref:Chemotaxis protein n=1 Tax=Rhodocista pekingensis TaxID=201185 RepID=A0ABW2KTB5_9PROT
MSTDKKPHVEIIRRPNRLREKVGGSADGKPGRIDPAALERAHIHVSRMADAHKAQTRIDLTDLHDAFNTAMADAENRPAHLRRVFKISEGILALGKTFGYDLLSEFAHNLNSFLVELEHPSQAQLTVIALHIDAMHAIVRDDIRGDGGELGRALSQSLAIARAKLVARKG